MYRRGAALHRVDTQRPLIHSDGRPGEGSTGTLRLQKGSTKGGGMTVMGEIKQRLTEKSIFTTIGASLSIHLF